ncbi:SusC/RagA family TonB-linked outer membrane protein [Bacteroides sp. AN502(2024)]|uniref:SusC/RagA family TonB-linked outer membrane protein n=1 Tax=Bacteroides sp. AN502(2024) TaxID=3160599 RepID=UPI0035145B65
MLKRLKSVSMVLFLLGASSGMAYAVSGAEADDVKITQQSSTCTGIVKDTKGETVIGASVIVKGTTNGTITGIDGDFSLRNVNKGDVIKISFVGYQTQEVTWNGQPLNIVLKDDSQTLQEVVVTALGLPKQAKSVGYATSRVSTTEIARANVVNPVNALQGKVAGVQINAGGASGITSSSSITIRGAKSVDKNNSPIFVIDGMIIQEAMTGNLAGTDWGSQLKNLNPADYESVTVLKGAAATALYGSRGANGAIVIVSKGGKYGKQGIGVEVNQTVEFTNVYKSPVELQNVYGAGTTYNGYQGDFLADGSLQKTSASWGPRMDGRMLNQYLPNGEDTPYVAHEDNWKEFYQTGVNNTTNVAISGGGEKSSFRVSYGYTSNKGVFKNNDFSRHNIAFKGNTELNKIFSVEVGVKYGFSSAKNGASQGGWDWGNNVGMITAYNLPRNYDIGAHYDQYRDPDTHAVRSTTYGTLSSYFHTRDTQMKQRNENSLLSDITLRAKITPWLTSSVKANYNYYSISTEDRWCGTGENYGPSGSGGYGRGGSTEGNYNFMGMLQLSEQAFKIADQDFTVSAIAAAELYGNTEKHSWNKSTNGGLVVPGVFSFSNSKNKIEPNFNYTPRNEQTFGISGIVNLGWKDQLFLELTARNDWLSTLTYPSYVVGGKNNYSVFYPSANASWVFTDTFRDKIPEWFSFGKLRASLARVGMGTKAYSTAQGYGVFNQNSIYLPDRSGSVLSANPNLGTAYNNNLKPEIQQSIELGFDLRFFDERLNVDFAYYKTNTYNQIMKVGSVAESGASSKLINAGNIQNQGIELQIDATPIRTKDWRWSLGGNLTVNRGKVVELDNEVKEWQLMGGYDAAPEIWAYEGGKFGVLTSYENSSYMSPIVTWQGENGDPRNGKMVIQYEQEYAKPNSVSMYSPVTYYQRNEEGDRERHILGKVEPDFTLSLNTSLSYKDFDLYIQGDGRFGGNYFSNMWKYSIPQGTLKSTLQGRDKEHGGIKRINYKGETVYDGLMLDAVFAEGSKAPVQNPDGSVGELVDVGGMTYKDAVEQKNIRPVMTGSWYAWNYGWGMPAMPGSIQDNTWFCLREITLGYRLPEKFCKKFGANYLRLGFTARNICYIINKLTDGLNPAAISNNNPLQPMDIGGVPFYRTYAFNLTVRF